MPSAMARKADVRKVTDYERRRPERTLLYQLVEEHYARIRELLANQGRSLPAYVQREFDDFLKCGILVTSSPISRHQAIEKCGLLTSRVNRPRMPEGRPD